MSDSKDIVVTYETLYELSRLEKNREELQKLDDSFFADVAQYLKDKISLLDESRHKDSLFAFEQKESITRQIMNAKKLIREIFERRERKIINMALNKVKAGGSIVIDTSQMLSEERVFYENIVGLLQANRFDILDKVLSGEKPVVFEKIKPIIEDEKKEKEPEPLYELKSDDVMVKFKEHTDKFVGFNLEEYGPYSEGDVTSLPSEIASLLIEQGKAERLNRD